MRPVVIDASALAAIVFDEPGSERLARRLEGETVFAPTLLKFELANVAWKKIRHGAREVPAILQTLLKVLGPRGGITWMDVDHADVALVAIETGLSSYDASYLWLAGSLGAELVTLDARLSAAGTCDVRSAARNDA
jgi:predicted nucleic acid-binding protein